ncbi:MAG: radical SAM protein [Clostridium sp.]
MDIKNNMVLTTNSLKERISDQILKNRIPIHTTISITKGCNFRCLYCYEQPLKENNTTIPLNQWKNILKQVKQRGCISLTITGGEPLYSKDFINIYEYAYDLNFKVNIITNLSLINDEVLTLLRKKPPVEISGTLYGVSNKTYDEFCKHKKGWDIVKNNIDKLLRNNINIKLHTVLNVYNNAELKEMLDYTNKNNINFHVYRKVSCDINGNKEPQKYQINQIQEIESYNIIKDEELAIQSTKNNQKLWEKGYKNCCAGISSCYINSRGEMYLCNRYVNSSFNVLDLGFDESWNNIYHLRKEIIEVVNECGKCKKNIYCGKCNPIFISEKDRPAKCKEFKLK